MTAYYIIRFLDGLFLDIIIYSVFGYHEYLMYIYLLSLSDQCHVDIQNKVRI